MKLENLLLKSRSYRRFYQNEPIAEDELKELISYTRLCPSARNAQPLKYRIVTDRELCASVFTTLSWAGYLTDWPGPEEGERPSAYLIQLLDTDIVENCMSDDGIQLQTILLGAAERGWGGCIIKAFKASLLQEILDLPERFRILHVIALGRPKEIVKIEKMQGGDYKYWRDEDAVHHVPKRDPEDLII